MSFTLDLKIANWSQGNFGAMNFFNELFYDKNMLRQQLIMDRLYQLKSIRGTNAYILWNDLCDKDMNKVAKLCERVPGVILEDVCNRQDRSGVKVVEKYFSDNWIPGHDLIKCPVCEGKREIFTDTTKDCCGPEGSMEVHKCQKCDGKGEIAIEIKLDPMDRHNMDQIKKGFS